MTQDDIARYVVENIDEACEKDWIKVYYQPVIRTLTGNLCGVESLARWDDPEVGFLPPYQFVGPLEKSEDITKLDCYIVDRVCKDISIRLAENKPCVPVSVNFSRLDFLKCDMLNVVETAVEHYDIPRDLIHIEITESIIVSDEKLMGKVINDFRDRGYEIWMDDFGSEYSSLNILKDFPFDVLKLDMRFLSSFTEKSKAIVRAIITMGKEVEIGTLAEGVETTEQVEFLKSIGCARLQGYFYSKPLPLTDLEEVMVSKGIKCEERKWRRFYDLASHHAKFTSSPLNVVEYEDGHFKTLFMNNAFKKQVYAGDETVDVLDANWYSESNPLFIKYIGFAEAVKKTKNQETFYYTSGGNYYCLKAQQITEMYGRLLIKATIANISMDKNTQERDRLDSKLKELNNVYESIIVIDPGKDKIEPLLGGFKYRQSIVTSAASLSDAVESFADNWIILPERPEFIRFMNFTKLQERFDESGVNFVEKIFRVKQNDGRYSWRSFIIFELPSVKEKEYMLTIRAIPNALEQILNHEASALGKNLINEDPFIDNPFANLWENAVWDSDLMFFWKDRDRRFLGASQAFLNFYGFESINEILGKNDEEMHWHVDDEPYMGDELDVIKHGKKVKNAPGQCIVNGVVHNIVCNKMPIYDNGEIIGLVGYFADSDEEMARVKNIKGPSRVDNITRLMNSRAFVQTVVDYYTEYNAKNRLYGLIMLENKTHERIKSNFQLEFSNEVLNQIGEKIIDVIGQTAAAARIKESVFAILTYARTKRELENIAEKVRQSVESINEVNDCKVTIRLKMASRLCNEDGVTADNLYPKVLGELGSL